MPKRLVFPSVSSIATAAIGDRSFSTSGFVSQLEPASHIPTTFTDGLPLPKIFVFDLDYTLWPFWVDTHVNPQVKPAHKDPLQNTAMVDRYGESYSFYPEVPGILHAARAKGVTMGLASRTHAPDLAEKMLRSIVIPVPPPPPVSSDDLNPPPKSKEKPTRAWDYFTHREIYPGSKVKHFGRIQSATATKSKRTEEVAFADMIFFDDEGRNREVETQLGVQFVLVRDGLTRDEVDRGVHAWRKRWGIAANGASEGGRNSGMVEDEQDQNDV